MGLDLGIAVEPSMPCRLLMVSDPQHVVGSIDGHLWEPVFHDDRRYAYTQPVADVSCSAGCLASTNPFTIGSLQRLTDGELVVGETGNGDGVVTSSDSGGSWMLRDHGLEGQAVGILAFSPTAPTTGYAVAWPVNEDEWSDTYGSGVQGPRSMYATTDGGGTWVARTDPVPLDGSGSGNATRAVAVDPYREDRIWLVGEQASQNTSELVVYRSEDGAASWSPVASLADFGFGAEVNLVAVRSPSGGTRLMLMQNGTGLQISDDGGATWWKAPLPVNSVIWNVVDPTSPNRVLVGATDSAGTDSAGFPLRKVRIFFSRDGALTFQEIPLPQLIPGDHWDDLIPTLPGGGLPPPIAPMQADLMGNFYVSVWSTCDNDNPSCPYSTSTGRVEAVHTLLRLTPPDRLPPGAGLNDFGTLTPIAAKVLKTCPQPILSSAPQSATLAFDGQDLLYTLHGESGPGNGQGLIHRMDPATCQDEGTIVVQFSQTDLAVAARHTPDLDTAHPVIGDMTYDARRNVLWATLTDASAPTAGTSNEVGDRNSSFSLGPNLLFTITLVHPAVNADAIGRLSVQNGCGGFLAYDFSRDALWTCDATAYQTSPAGGNGPGPGELRASDGASYPTCFTQLGQSFTASNTLPGWTLGAPPFLYTADEDNQTINQYRIADCAIVATYRHTPYNEPADEDEQLACDTVTFAGVGAGTSAHPALWLRNAGDQTVSAYEIPGGSCPLPTFTRYRAPAVLLQGAASQLCADVHSRSLEGDRMLPTGSVLSFAVDGTSAGSGTTDGGGVACTTSLWSASVAGLHAVTVTYAGSPSYLPSSADGTISVTASIAAVSAPSRAAGPPPPYASGVPPLSAPSTGLQGNPAPVNQTQPQSQTQPLSQPAPVGVMQHEAQPQVAAALNPEMVANEELGYNAVSATGPGSPWWSVATMLGGGGFLMFFGFGMRWALRGPRAEPARAKKRPPTRNSRLWP